MARLVICPECQKSRPIDLLVALANEVAVSLGKEFPDKFVGTLSYNRHSFPPTIRCPRPRRLLTTGFNYSGLSTEDLIASWKKMMDGPYLGSTTTGTCPVGITG